MQIIWGEGRGLNGLKLRVGNLHRIKKGDLQAHYKEIYFFVGHTRLEWQSYRELTWEVCNGLVCYMGHTKLCTGYKFIFPHVCRSMLLLIRPELSHNRNYVQKNQKLKFIFYINCNILLTFHPRGIDIAKMNKCKQFKLK